MPFRSGFHVSNLIAFLLVATIAGAEVQKPSYEDVPDIAPPYHRIRYEGSQTAGELVYPVRYTVWIPPNVKTLRAVIVHQHGCGIWSCNSGLTGAFDLHWQELAKAHDAALFAASYEQPDGAECGAWCDPRNGSSDTFLRSLADLSDKTGHPELATVPWALWGHSGGAYWVGGMTTLHPERVAAVWMRSGVPILEPLPDRPDRPHFTMPEAALKVPMMANLGTKEGFSVKEGRFNVVWPAVEKFAGKVRKRGGLIGVAIDPLTGHECGNQRYLAIPWFDESLKARLPSEAGEPMRTMSAEDAWLAKPTTTSAVPGAGYSGQASEAWWLPNAAVAAKWSEYVTDTAVSDDTPPPAPTNVKLKEGRLTWQAKADFESGIRSFLIERDGKVVGETSVKGRNTRGRDLFQGLTGSDTPRLPLFKMEFDVTTSEDAASNTPAEYRVRSVNTVGLRSQPSAVAEPSTQGE